MDGYQYARKCDEMGCENGYITIPGGSVILCPKCEGAGAILITESRTTKKVYRVLAYVLFFGVTAALLYLLLR